MGERYSVCAIMAASGCLNYWDPEGRRRVLIFLRLATNSGSRQN